MEENIELLKEENMNGSSVTVADEQKVSNGYAASERYFENVACPYYPCHKRDEAAQGKEVHLNCLFCYCPLYFLKEKCGGDFVMKNGVKSCIGCSRPHIASNFDEIERTLKEVSKGTSP